MNESFFKTPKWLADKKAEKERKRQEEERKRQYEERYEKNRRLEEERKAEEKRRYDKEQEIFNKLFNVIIQYIFANYKKCEVSVPKPNILVIKDNSMLNTHDLKWKITLNNTINIPTFDVYIYHAGSEYKYDVAGLVYTYLKNFMLDTVYEWYRIDSLYNKQKYQKQHTDDYGGYDYSSDYGNTKTKSKSKESEETEEVKNKRRRYQLLKDTLDGYNRQLSKIKDWERKNPGKTNDEKQIVLNQIANVKDKINLMNQKFKFESIYYLKHLKSILS